MKQKKENENTLNEDFIGLTGQLTFTTLMEMN